MITKEQLKQTIIDVVETNPGVSGVSLALKIMTSYNPAEINEKEYVEVLDKLINNGLIYEYFFYIPNKNGIERRGFFFPRNSIFMGLNMG